MPRRSSKRLVTNSHLSTVVEWGRELGEKLVGLQIEQDQSGEDMGDAIMNRLVLIRSTASELTGLEAFALGLGFATAALRNQPERSGFEGFDPEDLPELIDMLNNPGRRRTS